MHPDRGGVWVWALMTLTQYDLQVIATFQQYSSEVFRVNLGENESEASPWLWKGLFKQEIFWDLNLKSGFLFTGTYCISYPWEQTDGVV